MFSCSLESPLVGFNVWRFLLVPSSFFLSNLFSYSLFMVNFYILPQLHWTLLNKTVKLWKLCCIHADAKWISGRFFKLLLFLKKILSHAMVVVQLNLKIDFNWSNLRENKITIKRDLYTCEYLNMNMYFVFNLDLYSFSSFSVKKNPRYNLLSTFIAISCVVPSIHCLTKDINSEDSVLISLVFYEHQWASTQTQV